MLVVQDYSETITFLWLYIFIYNTSLVLTLLSLSQLTLPEYKTIHAFSFSNLDSFFTKSLTVALLSMAGVPPFIGFFSKMFIFVLISNSSLPVLSFTFLLLLFVSLYFYLQNVRFLNTSKVSASTAVTAGNLRVLPTYFRVSTTLVLVTMLGFLVIDDLVLIIIPWLLAL